MHARSRTLAIPGLPSRSASEDSSAIQAMAATCLQVQSPEDCLSSYQFLLTLLATYARGPLTFETVLWGAFSCLIACSALLWIWDSPHHKRKIAMIVVCILMYAMATAHWILSMMGISMIATTPTSEIIHGPLMSPWPLLADYLLSDDGQNAQTVLLTCSMLLSDLIVLYRACLVWGRKCPVQIISCVLYLSLIVTSVLCIYAALGSRGGFAPHVVTEQDVRCEFDIFCIGGIPATWVSLCLNIWATLIIGYKAWTHKLVIGKYLATGNTRTRSEKVLALLVDSGLLYCALWTFVTAAETSFDGGTFISIYLQNGGLIHLIGMYPTILVTAMSIERLKGSGTIHTVHVLTQGACAPAPAYDVRVDVQGSNRAPATYAYTESADSVIRIESSSIKPEDIEIQAQDPAAMVLFV